MRPLGLEQYLQIFCKSQPKEKPSTDDDVKNPQSVNNEQSKPADTKEPMPKELSELLSKYQESGCTKEEVIKILQQLNIAFEENGNKIKFKYDGEEYNLQTVDAPNETELAGNVNISQYLNDVKAKAKTEVDNWLKAMRNYEAFIKPQEIEVCNLLFGDIAEKAKDLIKNAQTVDDINKILEDLHLGKLGDAGTDKFEEKKQQAIDVMKKSKPSNRMSIMQIMFQTMYEKAVRAVNNAKSESEISQIVSDFFENRNKDDYGSALEEKRRNALYNVQMYIQKNKITFSNSSELGILNAIKNARSEEEIDQILKSSNIDLDSINAVFDKESDVKKDSETSIQTPDLTQLQIDSLRLQAEIKVEKWFVEYSSQNTMLLGEDVKTNYEEGCKIRDYALELIKNTTTEDDINKILEDLKSGKLKKELFKE